MTGLGGPGEDTAVDGEGRMTGSGRSSAGPSRRRFLAGVGTASLVGVAGCGGLAEVGTDADAWEDGGPPDREGWAVTFADRFDDGELDTGAWSYGMGGPTYQCPPQEGPNHCWAEDHAWVDDEADRLRLEASEETPDGDADYTFGAVCTDPHHAQEFGYFEAKCRMSATDGTLPAFWMLTDFDDRRYREMGFEARGSDDGQRIHYGYLLEGTDGELYDSGTQFSQENTPYQGVYEFDDPIHESYHVLGIEWTPEYIAYHVNGTEAERMETDAIRDYAPGAPMYVILNQGIFEGADWVGYPENGSFPGHHDVEWVRIWQREDRE